MPVASLKYLLRKNAFPLVIALAAVGLALGGRAATEWLRYDRMAILHGEVWRLVTANLVHLGWPHLLLNVFGLGLVWAFFGPCLSQRGWWWIALASALSTSVGLLVFAPQVGWYVGLSGALHGLFIAGAMADLQIRPREGALFLAALFAKLVWEQTVGPLPGSEETAGGPVLVDAHLYGAIGGLLAGGVAALLRSRASHAR